MVSAIQLVLSIISSFVLRLNSLPSSSINSLSAQVLPKETTFPCMCFCNLPWRGNSCHSSLSDQVHFLNALAVLQALSSLFNLTKCRGVSEHGWVPVLAITIVQSARVVGFMSIIQLLIAESFQTNIRFPSTQCYNSHQVL